MRNLDGIQDGAGTRGDVATLERPKVVVEQERMRKLRVR
jgi:hypothetical protein